MDHDEYTEDPFAIGRGIAYGIMIGSVMWAAIIGGVMLLMR